MKTKTKSTVSVPLKKLYPMRRIPGVANGLAQWDPSIGRWTIQVKGRKSSP